MRLQLSNFTEKEILRKNVTSENSENLFPEQNIQMLKMQGSDWGYWREAQHRSNSYKTSKKKEMGGILGQKGESLSQCLSEHTTRQTKETAAVGSYITDEICRLTLSAVIMKLGIWCEQVLKQITIVKPKVQ
jgi:hypothetical protein